MPAPDRVHPDLADAPTPYLLFAGLHGRDRRGTGDLVATLAFQAAARDAFRQIRFQRPDRDGSAELTAVSAGGRARRLSWFGQERQVGSSRAAWLLANREATTAVVVPAAGQVAPPTSRVVWRRVAFPRDRAVDRAGRQPDRVLHNPARRVRRPPVPSVVVA